MSQKIKCIEITTSEDLGFQEMSGMVLEIQKLVKTYQANYNVDYFFKE